MIIQLFNNGKGLIHGEDNKRIHCEFGGTLKIGAAEFKIEAGNDNVMPSLFNGATGHFNATFTTIWGGQYILERVNIKGGRIVSPSHTSVELMELRCKTECLEDRCASLEAKVNELSNIFDTDALNFLIK